MNNIIRLLLCLLILTVSSCSSLFERLFVLENLHDNDLEADFYIENNTDYSVEFYVQHYFGRLESQFKWSGKIDIGAQEALCKSCPDYTSADDDVIFQYYVVGIIKDDTYVQIKNLEDGTVVKWSAKDSPQGLFFNIDNWVKEDRVEGKMTYRKYTLILTNDIFNSNLPTAENNHVAVEAE